jgi:hypothetical protein
MMKLLCAIPVLCCWRCHAIPPAPKLAVKMENPSPFIEPHPLEGWTQMQDTGEILCPGCFKKREAK